MRITALLAVLVALLAGCAMLQKEQPPAMPVPAAEPVAEPVDLPERAPASEDQPTSGSALPESNVTVEAGVPEEGVYERAPEEPKTMADFLSYFRNNVDNYRFKFKSDTWYVAGRTAKIELFRVLENEYHAPFIDTIYLDLERRTAVGVCEGRSTNIRKQCALRQTLDNKYALPYVQFKIKLPEDWLVEFQNLYVSPAETPQLVSDRETVHMKHATKTRLTDLYIDPSSGLPVAVVDGGAEYKYEALAKNNFAPGTVLVPE
jgi:hypothetical protein